MLEESARAGGPVGTGWIGGMLAGLALLALAAPPVAAADEPPAAAVAEARVTADRLGGELRALLLDELKRGGPAAALEACAGSAQRATDGVALATGHRVRRVSLRPRNPRNEPRPTERAVLVELEPLARAGAMPAERIWIESDEAGRELLYLRPIQAGAVCLGCHGPADRLSPEVRAGLARHYPGDRAVGHQEGDLRGAIVVRLPLVDPPPPSPPSAPQPEGASR